MHRFRIYEQLSFEWYADSWVFKKNFIVNRSFKRCGFCLLIHGSEWEASKLCSGDKHIKKSKNTKSVFIFVFSTFQLIMWTTHITKNIFQLFRNDPQKTLKSCKNWLFQWFSRFWGFFEALLFNNWKIFLYNFWFKLISFISFYLFFN